MKTVQNGDSVKVNYKIVLDDGSIFETSDTMGPLEIKVGDGKVLQDLEQGLIGMQPGDSKSIRIPVERAYGQRRDERVFQMPKSKAPGHFETGKMVSMYRADGLPIQVKVIGENDEAYIIDGNHLLAGQDITFAVTLLSIA
jgi:peptidylprolyl isomerase